MKRIIPLIVIFLSGVVVTANLSILVHTNPSYDASWVNVGLALFLATVAAWSSTVRIPA